MMRKLNKRTVLFWCAFLGMSYFNAFSSIDLDPTLKTSLASVPIAIALLIFWLRSAQTSSNH